METIVEILQSPSAQALGWTLVHSLWQGMLCFLLGTALLRLIPAQQSSVRYATSVSVFGLLLLCSITTYVMVYEPLTPAATGISRGYTLTANSHTVTDASLVHQWASDINSVVSSRIGLVSALWLMGATFFLLRVASGYWYTGYIRRTAEPVSALWRQRLDGLAARLGVGASVELAQSRLISAPIVMGYFKPIILIPVGMFSGLTTEQLEAIFVHELMHIRRGDYFVNLLQSGLEALYFFNPFAWIMSANIRREREHCCDDGVVSSQGNAIAYVRALAILEEVKLSRTGISLSLAEEKNQLLKRIKRLMEKSVHHYSRRDRVMPALLLIIGLMCASWLTIQSRDRKQMQKLEQDRVDEIAMSRRHHTGQVDTTGRQKSGSYYRYSITTVDDEGKEDVHVIEGYSDEPVADIVMGVEPPAPVEPLEPIDPYILSIPNHVAPPFSSPTGPASVLPQVPPVGPMPMYFNSPLFEFDTIPQMRGSWEEFGREFEETFRERFEDFYKEHEHDMKEMMKEMESRFGDFEGFEGTFNEPAHAEELARHSEAVHHDNFARMEQAQRAMELAHMQSTQDQAHLADIDREMQRLNESMKGFENRLQEAQALVQKEAIEDGYLKGDEEINSISITNDSMEINGKKIKPADAKRYRQIIDAAEHQPGRRE